MSSSRADSVPIAVLGGSSAFLPSLAAALAERRSDLPALRVRLQGRDAKRTGTVAEFCSRYAASVGAPHRFTATTRASVAARDAAIVVNQVRIGGFAGRSRDEQLALEYGYPGDETIGPSGLSAAIRSLPPILALAKEVERVAPDAWFIQMSNPMSILLGGLLERTGLKTFGLCELPDRTLAEALGLVGMRRRPVSSDYAGLNHQGFFVRIEADGESLLPAIFDRVEALPGGGFFRVDASVMRDRRALPLPYLRLFEHREREVAAMRARERDRGAELAALAARLYASYAAAPAARLPAELLRREMPWNAMSLVPVLVALLGGPATHAFVSQPNAGYLSIARDDAIVEKRVAVTDRGPGGAAPLRRDVARTHPKIARLLEAIARFEQLGTAAALRRDRALAVAALCEHPFAIPEPLASVMAARMLHRDADVAHVEADR